MRQYYIYLIGILVLVAFFGFSMVMSGAGQKEIEIYDVEVINGISEVRLGLKDYSYHPNVIRVEVGKPVRIYLESSVIGCLRDFTIRDFDVHEYLKTPQDYVEFTPIEKGRHVFACSMGMGTGVLIVE